MRFEEVSHWAATQTSWKGTLPSWYWHLWLGDNETDPEQGEEKDGDWSKLPHKKRAIARVAPVVATNNQGGPSSPLLLLPSSFPSVSPIGVTQQEPDGEKKGGLPSSSPSVTERIVEGGAEKQQLHNPYGAADHKEQTRE